MGWTCAIIIIFMKRQYYIPNQGDIIWVNFDPVIGHEQGGFRPAVVLSTKKYHGRSNLAIICPITSRKPDFFLDIPFITSSICGTVLTDHLRSIDYINRKIQFTGELLPQESLQKVFFMIRGLLNIRN